MEKLTEMQVDWKETKKKLKQKFIVLNDNDLLFVNGRQEDMFRRLQVKLGKNREEIIKLISNL